MMAKKRPKLAVISILSNSCSFGLRNMLLFSNLNNLQAFDKISSRKSVLLKVRPLRFLETSFSYFLVTWSNIPEEQNPRRVGGGKNPHIPSLGS